MAVEKRVPATLELRLDGAATPARVARAAQFFDALLKAADPTMPDEAVTMVVRNFSTKAALRPQTEVARASVRKVISFLKEPKKPTKGHPERAELARVLDDNRQLLLEEVAAFYKPSSHELIVRVDRDYLEKVSAIRRATPTQRKVALRGGTSVVSKVLRIGRSSPGGELTARIGLQNTWVECRVDDAVIDCLAEAVRSGATLRLRLSVEWLLDVSGQLLIDPKTARIVGAAEFRPPISGEELTKRLASFPSGTLDDEFMS